MSTYDIKHIASSEYFSVDGRRFTYSRKKRRYLILAWAVTVALQILPPILAIVYPGNQLLGIYIFTPWIIVWPLILHIDEGYRFGWGYQRDAFAAAERFADQCRAGDALVTDVE